LIFAKTKLCGVNEMGGDRIVKTEHGNGNVNGNGARTGQALRASELSYRRLFEAAQDGVLILDADTGRINDANPFLINLLGFSRAEMVGKTVGELSPFKDIWSNKVMLERLQKDGYVRYHDLPLETRDGRKIAVEFVSNVYQAGDEQVIQCNIRDITERKRTEGAMFSSEARYRRLFEAAKDGILILNAATGRIVDANPFLTELLGYAREAFIGKHLWELGFFKDIAANEANFKELQAKDYIRYDDLPFETSDGRRIDVEFVSNVYNVDGHRVMQCNFRDITERKRAEESNVRLAAIVESSDDAIIGKSSDGRIQSWNAGAEKLFGYSAGEMTGDSIMRLIPADRQDEENQILEKIRHGEGVRNLESVWQAKDGRRIDVSVTVSPIKDSTGKIVGASKVARDITERKQMEKALGQSEEQLRAMFDLASVGIAQADPRTGQWLRVNEKMCEITGYSAGELLQLHISDIIFSEDRQSDREVFERVVRGESPDYRMEKRYIRKDGALVWVNVNMTVVRDAAGQPTRTMAVIEDITERKQAEEKLKLFRLLIECSNDAIEVVDSATGRFLDANESGCRALGYTRDEMLSLTVFDLTPEVNRALFDANNAQIKKAGHATLETLRRRKDGTTFPVEVSLSSVTLDREYAVAIVRDITGRRKLEAQFIEAQKMEVVGQLAGGVAHDFNNIIAVIMGYGNLITADLEPDSPLRKYAEEIQHATKRAAGLTRQLLVFSRNQTVQPVVLDLNDAVKDLDKMLRRLVDEHIEMAVVLEKQNGRIKADPGYIWQVLMNLVVNARDAMPNGGKLTIATQNVTLDENYTRTHTGIIPGDYVMLTVSDSGTGMTDEVKARMFEAFFTTKPKGKGTGLGLATCRTIVQQSGGRIDVESEVGKGSTFKIYFPRVDEPVDADTKFIKAGPIPRGTETVLLVEDEPSLRHLAAGVLEAQGYNVLRASNGQDALRVAREHKGPPIRLVVTDIVMPQMGGKVMAEWLKTTYPDLKILFTSGYTDDAIAQHGALEPGVAFLPKPYTSVILARKVRAMLDNQTDSAFLRKHSVTINEIPPGSA
jgi:two-component system cell cycle sensor histidine kinase/response regulator CckA